MFQIDNHSKSFADRKPAVVRSTVTAEQLKAWRGGMILTRVVGTDEFELADGAGFIPDPRIIVTDGRRGDVQSARAITIVEGPDMYWLDNEAYDGNPVKGSAMGIGTGALVGKLVIVATPTTVAQQRDVVAYCEKAPDSKNVAGFRFIR